MSLERQQLFWARVDKTAGPDGCWPWRGGFDGNGYGRIKVPGGVSARAHRVAYYLETGTDPADNMVCHKCDNPPCCNPAHHFLGDNGANQRDAIAKGRKVGRPADGERNPNAKLSLEQVGKVREMIRGGSSNKAIARVFGVTHQLVSRIRRGRAWGAEPIGERYASLRR